MLRGGVRPSGGTHREVNRRTRPYEALKRERHGTRHRRTNIVAGSFEKIDEWSPHVVRNLAIDDVAPESGLPVQLDADRDQYSKRTQVAAESAEVLTTDPRKRLAVGREFSNASR